MDPEFEAYFRGALQAGMDDLQAGYQGAAHGEDPKFAEAVLDDLVKASMLNVEDKPMYMALSALVDASLVAAWNTHLHFTQASSGALGGG